MATKKQKLKLAPRAFLRDLKQASVEQSKPETLVGSLVTRSRPQAFGMKGAPIEPEFVGVVEAQVLSGISKWTWRQLAYTRKIESVKIGTRLLLPLVEVRRVIAEGRRERADGLPAGAPSDRATIVRKPKAEQGVHAE
jgi:hypothetical protein